MPETGTVPPAAAPQLVLAFDYGRRRIGVACGDTLSRSATALSAVVNDATGPRWTAVDALLRTWVPGLLVVGLPYHADGSESPMNTRVRGFAAELARRYQLPVRLIDERYSSMEAATVLKARRATGLRKRRVAKADIDAAAACIILERWFLETTEGAHAFTT